MAGIFSNKYRRIFDANSTQRSDAEFFKSDMNYSYNEISKHFISGSDVRLAIEKLKPGVGNDRIHSNHLKFGSSLLEKLIGSLFSSFLLHGYVSIEMLRGTINPTVKDVHGNLQSSDNYRPVMLSSVLLKLFEYCLQDKLMKNAPLLKDCQHGFRGNYSTSSACFVLKETVLNYTNASSNVYACFIDFSKAFDMVNHKILLGKLKGYGIPDVFINVIKFWYSNQLVNVRYGTALTDSWKICNGVRQGGVLSGFLFNIYIDSLLERILKSKYGCRLGFKKSSVIAYADDIVLLAPSATGLQALIDIAYSEAHEMKMKINIDKSKCLIFRCPGSQLSENISFHIGNKPLQIVNSFKYLGFIVNSRLNNSEDIDRVRCRFYKEFNVVLRKFSFADVRVKLYLFRQYCLQFYGPELWFSNKGSVGSLRDFELGYHKAIKKILGLSYRESNHFACQEANLLTFEHLMNKIKVTHAIRLLMHPCEFIRRVNPFLWVSSVFYNEIYELLEKKYEIDSIVLNDKEAIVARIGFVQNHEEQSRGPLALNAT